MITGFGDFGDQITGSGSGDCEGQTLQKAADHMMCVIFTLFLLRYNSRTGKYKA